MTAVHPKQKLADDQAAGLRALAGMIEANPELIGSETYMRSLHVWSVDSAEDLARIARAALSHGAKVDKDISEKLYNLDITWHGITASVLARREEVCERVVVGTETVTKTVKDPALLEIVPDIEVTETVEKVEWVCRPLLAETGTA